MRRHRHLELNAEAIQRKLNGEKQLREQTEREVQQMKSEVTILAESNTRLETEVHIEMDRCDELEREKIELLNKMEIENVCILFFYWNCH